VRSRLPSGLQPRVARAAAFLIEAGHTTNAAIAMAHAAVGKGKVPEVARAVSSLRMTSDELEGFACSLQARRVIAEGVLLSLAGEVRDGAVLSAHTLCETTHGAGRPVVLRIGGQPARHEQVIAARERIQGEIRELDDIVEATLTKKAKKDAKPDVLGMKTAGPKADARVVHLQNRLNSLGHHIQSDGIFGEVTNEAVKDFQTKINVDPSGEVDDDTSEALRNGGKPKPDPEMLKKQAEGMRAAKEKENGSEDGSPGSQTGSQVDPQAGSKTTSGWRTVTIKLSEADGKGDFPMSQMPSACPECGAPMRKSGVCQRGHHITKTGK
jgi:hypothetical protein